MVVMVVRFRAADPGGVAGWQRGDWPCRLATPFLLPAALWALGLAEAGDWMEARLRRFVSFLEERGSP